MDRIRRAQRWSHGREGVALATWGGSPAVKPGSMPTTSEATGADPGKGSCWPGLGACGSVWGLGPGCAV